MKRRRLPPDNRLDWRDPNMPLLKLGFKNKELVLFEVSPEKVRMWYEHKMANHPAPDWRDDETYDLASKVQRNIK